MAKFWLMLSHCFWWMFSKNYREDRRIIAKLDERDSHATLSEAGSETAKVSIKQLNLIFYMMEYQGADVTNFEKQQMAERSARILESNHSMVKDVPVEMLREIHAWTTDERLRLIIEKQIWKEASART